jgi:hypothetical protein
MHKDTRRLHRIFLMFAGYWKFNDHRYGRMRPYRASVPLRQRNFKVSVKPSESLPTIGTVGPDRTTRPYRIHDFENEKLKISSKLSESVPTIGTGGLYRTKRCSASTTKASTLWKTVSLTTINTRGYGRTIRPYRLSRLSSKADAPGMGGMRSYHTSNDLNTQGRGKQPKFSYSLSSSSKLKTYSIGSSILFVFNLIPRTRSKYGTFLLRSLTFYPRMHALAFAIINLDLGHIMNFIIIMSMLDHNFGGDSFIKCV